MNGPSDDDRSADRQGCEWLDADELDNASHSLAEMPSEVTQRRIADLQLVDALLAHMSPVAGDEQEHRVRRVMEVIDDGGPSLRQKRSSPRVRAILVLAASILVVFSLFRVQFARESHANSVLQEIGRVAIENVDRIYKLRRSGPTADTNPAMEGKLYLRGRAGFVLLGANVVLGRSESEYWMVPRQGAVVVAEDFGWMVADSKDEGAELELLKQLSADSRRVPIMQLSAVTELMSHDYEVSLQQVDHEEHSDDKIVGVLRDKNINLPDEISLSADRETRIIHRAEFHWGSADSLILELAPSELVADDWYDHQSHHDDPREVRRITHESP